MVLDRVGGDEVISLNRNPPENSCRPAADPLFRSAASLYGARCLGVVMTGMGQDGLKGSEALFAAGGTIIVQDKDSSIVWGMPKLVAQAGLAEEQVPLNRLAAAIIERVRPLAVSLKGQGIENQNRAANAYSPDANAAQGRSS
jgi:two-component system chemotaxis response regulator CheB